MISWLQSPRQQVYYGLFTRNDIETVGTGCFLIKRDATDTVDIKTNTRESG